MKKTDLIKDFIISILIVICIILIITVIFYDSISLGKVIPESEEYMLTDEMQEDLDDTYDETTEMVTTYYIDAADLKKYEQTNEYTKGKKNPFAQESETATDTNILNNNLGNETDSSKSETFYDDLGIK